MDEVSVLSFNLELNKLLVPSPVATYKDGVFIGYQQPDMSFIKGIFNPSRMLQAALVKS